MLFCVVLNSSISQNKWELQIVENVTDKFSSLNYKQFKSKESLNQSLEKKMFQLVKNGHVLASIDSITWHSDYAIAYVYSGPKYDKITITMDAENLYYLRKVPNIKEKFLLQTPFKPNEIAKLLAGVISYLQNNGYPFARVWLAIDDLSPENATAKLMVDKNQEIRITEIHYKGEVEMSEKFLNNSVALKINDLYNEERLGKISARIQQIPFIDEIKQHELLFTPEGVEVFMYLKSNPVSLINGVVGLQPNPITGENVITGDVRLKLQNVIKRGELIDLNWRSLQPSTQDLKIRTNYPFLFDTPLGVDARFELYQRDSTFLSTQLNLGLPYFMRGGNYFKVFFEADNSNLLSGVNSSTGLPNTNFSSVSSSSYGLGLYRRQIDYLPNPSKGIEIELDGLVGRRSSRRINSDSSNVATTYELRLDLNWFIPISRRHVIRVGNNTRAYYAPEIFVNELYRFGGLTSQRGFDEEELFASTRTTFSMEYRFLVDQDSHAFLFYDQSFYENNSGSYYQDRPFGVGAGFSFGTNLGIFSISYAVGKQMDNPILMRNGKVHFGYVSYF